jgi:hypothetical protein
MSQVPIAKGSFPGNTIMFSRQDDRYVDETVSPIHLIYLSERRSISLNRMSARSTRGITGAVAAATDSNTSHDSSCETGQVIARKLSECSLGWRAPINGNRIPIEKGQRGLIEFRSASI